MQYNVGTTVHLPQQEGYVRISNAPDTVLNSGDLRHRAHVSSPPSMDSSRLLRSRHLDNYLLCLRTAEATGGWVAVDGWGDGDGDKECQRKRLHVAPLRIITGIFILCIMYHV